VFADGSTLTAPVGNLLGQDVHVDGTVAGTHPGDAVQVQRLDPAAGWVTVATATVAADGSFDAAWTPAAAGATKLRAVPANQAAAARSTDATTAADADGRAFTVFRPVRASWYGPGFYGRRTACGRRMTTRLLGVAHRTLPCGTLVQLYNDGHTITVPVVDRGPFRRGTSYDLTVATARALGVVATTRLGAMRVP
jgi:rare lipoprotein A